MINISRALEIEGWMAIRELEYLAEKAQEHKIIVELGSFLGRSTRALGDNAAGVVYAIDDWCGPRDVELKGSDRRNLFSNFIKNMAGLEKVVIPILANHEIINTSTLGIQPDMVFIDGDHIYESVVKDIKNWVDLIVPGGLLCGHDIQYDDVFKAVTDCLGRVNVVIGTSIWYTYKDIQDNSSPTMILDFITPTSILPETGQC